MATQILAVGATAADSADVAIAAGSQLTVALKDATAPTIDPQARVLIQLKDDAGLYFTVDELRWPERSSLVIQAAGTYRFSRVAGAACGVFSG